MRYKSRHPASVVAEKLPQVFDIDGRLAFEKWLVRHKIRGCYIGSDFKIIAFGVHDVLMPLIAYPGDYIVKFPNGVEVINGTFFQTLYAPTGDFK